MDTEQDPKSKDDTIVIILLIDFAGILLLFFMNSLSLYLRAAGIMSLVFCLVVARLGKDRKIGFSRAYFTSFFLSPIIGLIITLSSAKLIDEEYKEKMLEIAEQNASASSLADELYKLNELRKEGVLTEEEFTMQKAKLLNN